MPSVGGNMVATMEVAPESVSSYGILDVDQRRRHRRCACAAWSRSPSADVAPSNMAVIGRYILTPQVLRNLEDVEAGVGGEIQLTDAIAAEIATRGDVSAFRFKGRRFDCGSKPGYLQATVAFGLARPDLRDEFLDFLRTVTESEPEPSAKLAARG